VSAPRRRVWEGLLEAARRQGAAHLVLVDPDRTSPADALALARECSEAEVDALLFGSSTPLEKDPGEVLASLRRGAELPVILFPGAADQLREDVDAVLFLSLLSGRDPRFLIDEQVRAAPRVFSWGLEAIPTGYLLMGETADSTVARVTGTGPLPVDPSRVAVAHAQAAACLGMALVYLEGGSGSSVSLPPALVRAVSEATAVPVAVGGGIRTPEVAAALAAAGARFIVTGTAHERGALVRPFTEAVHGAAVPA
jgi:phosphoglycerol geranylgeranyltransferase